MNLFIAIILDSYEETNERNSKMFNSDLKENFREVWSYYDQEATGYLKISDFPNFML